MFSLSVVPAAWADSTPLVIKDGEPGAKALGRTPGLLVYSGDGSAFMAGLGASTRNSGHLHWTTWNQTQARGWGGDWHDDCTPDCADGTYSAYRVNVHLYRPEQLGGHLVFSRMTMTYPARRPPYPAYRTGTVTMSARYEAQYDSYFWS
jgi:hypothetical protein